MSRLPIKWLLLAIANAIIFELVAIILVNGQLINATIPTYEFQKRRFFGDYDENFGTWHVPNSQYRHKTKCFDARYEFNSIGAKDGEFTGSSKFKSAILIGDSMAEGFGLSNEHSLDAAIEDLSGLDVLNFGTSGVFGTTQYSLLYEKFNQQFEHQYLFVMLTLSNDFLDDSASFGRLVYNNRYRPYKTPSDEDANDYVLSYLGRSELETYDVSLKDFLSGYFASYHFLKFVYKRVKWNSQKRVQFNANVQDELAAQPDGKLQLHNLRTMSAMAHANKVETKVIIAPSFKEVAMREQDAVTKTFKTKLENELPDIQVIDPHQLFVEHAKPRQLFHACDAHLSKAGVTVIAEAISASLQ